MKRINVEFMGVSSTVRMMMLMSFEIFASFWKVKISQGCFEDTRDENLYCYSFRVGWPFRYYSQWWESVTVCFGRSWHGWPWPHRRGRARNPRRKSSCWRWQGLVQHSEIRMMLMIGNLMTAWLMNVKAVLPVIGNKRYYNIPISMMR